MKPKFQTFVDQPATPLIDRPPHPHVYTAEVHNNNTSGLTVITLITFLFTTYTSRLEEFELRNCTLLYFPLSPAFKQVTVVS